MRGDYPVHCHTLASALVTVCLGSNGQGGEILPQEVLDNPPSRRGCGVARIWRSLRLDQQDMGFVLSNRAVLDTFRDDKHFAWAKRNGPISQLNANPPLDNKEKIVRIVVLMPYELAFDFDDHEIVTVELSDDAWMPVL